MVPFALISNSKTKPISTQQTTPRFCVRSAFAHCKSILISIYSTSSASAYCFDHQIIVCFERDGLPNGRWVVLWSNVISHDESTFALWSIVCLWFNSLWNAQYLVLCVFLQCLQCVAPSHVIPCNEWMAASMQTRQRDDSPFFFVLFPALYFCSVLLCDCFLSVILFFVSSPLCACALMHLLWWWWRLRRDGNRNWMSGSQWFHSLSIDVICCSINQYIVSVGSWMFSAFAACPMCRNMSTLLGTEPLAYNLGMNLWLQIGWMYLNHGCSPLLLQCIRSFRNLLCVPFPFLGFSPPPTHICFNG